MAQRGQKILQGIRWAFRFGDWQPTREQWLRANSCVQYEERERISKFVFKKDAKAAIAGRLLLRRAISSILGIPQNEIQLTRTEKGKPYLHNENEQLPYFSFNVSHQGAFSVIAAEPYHNVGIDIMNIEYPRGSKSTKDFFDTMDRQFTKHEWTTIRGPMDEWEQLAEFYRHWCLKESYVKAVGTGIGFSLQRLDFHIKSPIEPGTYTHDTQVHVDGNVDKDWMFEETMLDNTHCVAVALQKVSEAEFPVVTAPYQLLDFSQLMEGALPLSQPKEQLWLNFDKKEDSPPGRKL